MKFTPLTPPRVFEVGLPPGIDLRDCGRIELDTDEQVTFVTGTGAEYDVTRKSWGFYATPSLNGRLAGFGLKAALVRASTGRYYVLLVEQGKEEEFRKYAADQGLAVVLWLDSDSALQTLESALDSHDAG